MANGDSQLQWTDEQWNRVRQVVYEEARGARVAGSLLPLFGPLGPDATFVAKEIVRDSGLDAIVPKFSIDDRTTLPLHTVQTNVELQDTQVADPALASALIAFRRAANVLARKEDDLIFFGPGAPPAVQKAGAAKKARPKPRSTTGGLLEGKLPLSTVPPPLTPEKLGNALVGAISKAVSNLEGLYHLGPFACILDQFYFNAVQTPTPSLVLPQDRILPFLGGGALVRSSILPDYTGLVIALGGAPIDLAVGTDISVEFLQVTPTPTYVFRVYEKIVLRVKEPSAIQAIPFDVPL